MNDDTTEPATTTLDSSFLEVENFDRDGENYEKEEVESNKHSNWYTNHTRLKTIVCIDELFDRALKARPSDYCLYVA